jgi:GNAT superfamily N-acetyltransferase
MRIYELFEAKLDGDISSLVSSLKARYPLHDLFLAMNSVGDLRIVSIIVDKEHRHENVGTNVLNEIIRFADKHNIRLTLSPALKDKHHGTTSQSRLIKFYKRFGFVQNKGRNKDFTISDSMYRNPS